MAKHPNWYQFQEDICSYFISIGANKKQVRKDMSKSIYYYELDCTYGDYRACGILGDIYLKKAIKVQKKSCELGHKNSCKYYQQLKKI